jgi:hypothetical protein
LGPKNANIPKKNTQKSEFSLRDFCKKVFFEVRNPTERKKENCEKKKDNPSCHGNGQLLGRLLSNE